VARYLSKVASLAMHSFSIWPAITFESVSVYSSGLPLLSTCGTALYSATLLMHVSVSAVNCKHAAYLSLMSKGDIQIVVARALETP
jgi:hypothetical protein